MLPGQIEPASLDGQHTTVEGQKLAVKGSGNNLTVNGAHVICGGVHTANATVYLTGGLRPPQRRTRPPGARGLVLRVVRDPAQSEEVTQEVFLQV